jgi:hypothetical protein
VMSLWGVVMSLWGVVCRLTRGKYNLIRFRIRL